MMMQLGAEGVFVGSGIFKSGNPAAAGRGDRQGHHLLRRPRRAGQGVARAGRGHGRHQRRGDPAAAPAGRTRLVARRWPSAVPTRLLGGPTAHVSRPSRSVAASVIPASPVESEVYDAVDAAEGLRCGRRRRRRAGRRGPPVASRSQPAERWPRADRRTAACDRRPIAGGARRRARRRGAAGPSASRRLSRRTERAVLPRRHVAEVRRTRGSSRPMRADVGTRSARHARRSALWPASRERRRRRRPARLHAGTLPTHGISAAFDELADRGQRRLAAAAPCGAARTGRATADEP